MLSCFGALIMAAVWLQTAICDNAFIPKVPQECLKQGICENLPDYPWERAAALIKTLGDKRYEYNIDELGFSDALTRGTDPSEVPLCESSTQKVIPIAGQDKDGRWHYILNQRNDPLQLFRVEVCKYQANKKPCDAIAHFPVGYNTTCEQKFIVWTMDLISEEGNLTSGPIRLPSSCYCKVMPTWEPGQH